MCGNISEKQGVEWNLERMQIPPKIIPRSLALGGMSDDVTGSERTARTEVNKNTLYLGQNHVFLFNLISEGTYLHAGHRRRPNDVAPLNCLVY